MAMTTNGVNLTRLLPQLHSAGVNTINISLDTLNPQRYSEITKFNGNYTTLINKTT